MDPTLWLNGQQSSQWHQQTWSQAGCSNTQYSVANYPQSTQFNPGYGVYYSGQTSNHQNSTSAQQLPTKVVHHLPNNFAHGNANLQNSYKAAQTVPHQWQVSNCQITTQQHYTSNVNWSNQRPPTSTTQAASFPRQNTQYIVPVIFNYIQKSPQTTMPQNACKESNIVKKYKGLQTGGTSQSSTHGKTRKEDAPPPPYPASKMRIPAYKHIRSKEHDATFDSSSGQLPGSQTHLPLQSCVGKAPAFSNSPVTGGTSQSFTPSQTKKVTREEDTPPPPYPASEMQMHAYKHSRSKEHDATFDSSSGKLPVSQTHLPLHSYVGMAPAFSNSPVNLAPLSNNTQLSQANNGQLAQTSHSSVNPCNEGSHPISISHQKAVAVVQPLSQQSNQDQVTAKKSCPEMIGQHKYTSTELRTKFKHLMKLLICDNSPQNNEVSSGIPSDLKDPLNGNVAPTNDGIVTTIQTVEKYFTNAMQDATPTLLSNGNGKQSKAHHSVTMEASQGGEIDKSTVPSSELDTELILPVITWTYEKLFSLIAASTSSIKLQPKHSNNVVKRITKCLWDNDFLFNVLKTEYEHLITDVIKFSKDTHSSPILSQLESNSWPRLKKNFTVLDHGCVYSESPYVSTWLNVNKQLDDIDKEFGFPLSLMIREHTCNTETEPMETNCDIPVDIVKELEVEKVPQMAPALDVEDVVENVVSILPTKYSQYMVPVDSLTVDPKDPLDLLEIRVLPPDEARTLFEKFDKNEPPVLEFKSNEMISTEEIASLEEYCCIIRWKEVSSGMELVDGKCCCTSLESNMPSVISTDALLDPSEEGDIIDASLNPMQSNSSDISKIIDLAEELEVQQKVDCHLPITHPWTSVDLTEEEEIINDILSTVNGESISTPALEEGCIKVDLISACQAETLNIEPKQAQDHDDNATAQSNGNHITEARDDHSPATEAVLNIEPKLSNCDLHDFKSIMSSLTIGPTRLSPTARPKDDYSSNLKKRPRASSELKRPKVKKMRSGGDSVQSVSQPALGDTSNNIIKEKVDADDSTTAAKKTVKFSLFGSIQRMKELRGKSPTSCPYFSGLSHQAPSVITLTRSPVKSRLCEEWEKSYLPITRKKLKNKTIKDVNGNSASATAAHGGRKSTAKDLPLETSKMSKNHMTKKVHRKSKSKSKKDADVPLKKNRVLGVLRNTFHLKDGHRNDKRYSVGGKLQRFEDYFRKMKR